MIKETKINRAPYTMDNTANRIEQNIMFKIKYNNVLTAVGQTDDEYDFERIETSKI